ncbi:hypothetical protein ACRQ5Q_14395 [Bradyrhizobium sp. PMVTL-01]|uniref:hypothetical protein n=1 Tax=Bradyrhizobium sp. PMVTL-01 TaxID=3434999 RepID=UPI003F71F6B8
MADRFQPLDKLPLFPTEQALACALLGPGRTTEWNQIAPLLEKRGLPKIDGLMGGRYTPAVRRFFDLEYKVGDAENVVAAPHQPAALGAYSGRRRVSARS